MRSEIEILNALEALIEAVAIDSYSDARQARQRCLDLLAYPFPEGELLALAILARETLRGNHATDIPRVHAAAERDFGLAIPWDTALASLAKQHLITVMHGETRERVSDAKLVDVLAHGNHKQLRVSLRLRDTAAAMETVHAGYASNKDYLRDCFRYIDALHETATRQGQPCERRHRDEARAEWRILHGMYTSIRAKALRTSPLPPAEELAARLALDKREWTMLLFVLRMKLEDMHPKVHELNRVAGGEDIFDRYAAAEYIRGAGKLIEHNLLKTGRDSPLKEQDVTIRDDLAHWLISDGTLPWKLSEYDYVHGAVPFDTNREYIEACCALARTILFDDALDEGLFRRYHVQLRQFTRPVTEMPEVKALLARINISRADFPLENIIQRAQLDLNERVILMLGVYVTTIHDDLHTKYACKLLAGQEHLHEFTYEKYFRRDAALRRHGLIRIRKEKRDNYHYSIPTDTLHHILGDDTLKPVRRAWRHRLWRRRGAAAK